jgi:hypothetical protein
MSFDICYQPCRFGMERVAQRNPFTGEVKEVLPALPLCPSDLKAVQDVLASVSALKADEHGCYLVQFRDGGFAEVYAGKGLETGCMIALRMALTPDLLRFLYNLLRAADWIMLPAMEDTPAITAVPGRAEGFADSFPEVVCNSARELGALLTGGFESWKRYRDQILGT